MAKEITNFESPRRHQKALNIQITLNVQPTDTTEVLETIRCCQAHKGEKTALSTQEKEIKRLKFQHNGYKKGSYKVSSDMYEK